MPRERSELLKGMVFTFPKETHSVQTPHYMLGYSWLEQASSTLCIHGDAGIGKS